jgi:hypothetical protein
VEPTIASTVTATSVMLAAYGFFYGALKGRIEAGSDVGDLAGEPDAREEQRGALRKARNTALALGIVPLGIFLIFLKEIVNEIDAALDVNFALSHYSALDIVFVLIASSWLLIAVILLVQAGSLHSKLGEYAEPAEASP